MKKKVYFTLKSNPNITTDSLPNSGEDKDSFISKIIEALRWLITKVSTMYPTSGGGGSTSLKNKVWGLDGNGNPGWQDKSSGPKGDPGDAAGFGIPTVSVDNNTGTPSVEIQTSGPDTAKIFKFIFKNLKGAKGDPGAPGGKGDPGAAGASAGFGTPTATVDANVGTPSVSVTATGNNTAKVFNFSFKNLKGAKGDTGATPSLVNNLLATVAGKALDAYQGKVLNDKITSLQTDVSTLNGKLTALLAPVEHYSAGTLNAGTTYNYSKAITGNRMVFVKVGLTGFNSYVVWQSFPSSYLGDNIEFTVYQGPTAWYCAAIVFSASSLKVNSIFRGTSWESTHIYVKVYSIGL